MFAAHGHVVNAYAHAYRSSFLPYKKFELNALNAFHTRKWNVLNSVQICEFCFSAFFSFLARLGHSKKWRKFCGTYVIVPALQFCRTFENPNSNQFPASWLNTFLTTACADRLGVQFMLLSHRNERSRERSTFLYVGLNSRLLPLSTDVTLQIPAGIMRPLHVNWMHLFVDGNSTAQLANHVHCFVAVLYMFADEGFRYIFLANRTFDALVFRYNVIVKKLLRVKAVDTR